MSDENQTSEPKPEKDKRYGEMSEAAQKIALMHFDHVERQIQLAATKAALMVTADALILTAYLKVVNDYQVFDHPIDIWTWLFGLGGILLLVGLCTALLAVWPKIRTDGDAQPLFYGWIATAGRSSYVDTFRERDKSQQLGEDVLLQIHGKSQWLAFMFQCTRVSITCIIASIILCAPTLLSSRNKGEESSIEFEILSPLLVFLVVRGARKKGEDRCGRQGRLQGQGRKRKRLPAANRRMSGRSARYDVPHGWGLPLGSDCSAGHARTRRRNGSRREGR